MAIGCFADLVFEVDGDYVLTFDQFKHDVKSRYARHERSPRLWELIPLMKCKRRKIFV